MASSRKSRKLRSIALSKFRMGGEPYVAGTVVRHGKSWAAVIDHGRENGRRARKWFYFASKREAEACLFKYASHPAFGSGLGPYGSTRLRVGEYLEQWLEDIKDRIRLSTHRRYEFLVKKQLQAIAHIPLYRLTMQDVERCYRGLKVSSTTAH